MVAMEQLREAGYTEAVRVEGGYEAWTQVGCCWVTSCELVAAASSKQGQCGAGCRTAQHGDSLSSPLLELASQHRHEDPLNNTPAPRFVLPQQTRPFTHVCIVTNLGQSESVVVGLGLGLGLDYLLSNPRNLQDRCCVPLRAGVQHQRPAQAAPRPVGVLGAGGAQVGAQHPGGGGELRRGGQPDNRQVRQGLPRRGPMMLAHGGVV